MIESFAWNCMTGEYIANYRKKNGKLEFRKIYNSQHGYYIRAEGINKFFNKEETERLNKFISEN